MYFDPYILLYGAIFVATLLLIEGAYYLLRDLREGPQNAVNRRMRMIASGTDTRTALRKLRRDTKDPLSRMLSTMLPSTDRLILHAGLTISVGRLFMTMIVIWAVLFALLEVLTPLPPVATVAISTVLGIGAPYLYMLRKRSVRVSKFGEELPDSIDLVVRGLRAGHPVSSAIGLVAKEMPDPIGSEFGIVVDEMTFGLDLSEALGNLLERVPHDDLRFLVVTIQIQNMIGGNLAEVLSNLSTVIRDRYQMYAKVKAVTAEGRASAVVIGVLPMVFAGLIMLLQPDFFLNVVGDPLFWPLIGVGVLLMVIGQVIIYKMVRFEV